MNTSLYSKMKMRSTLGSGGFTLIEMMITVAIIAILAGIALPNYTEHIKRTQRANARNTLIQAAQWMERAATATGTYPLSTASPSQIPSGILKVEGELYTVTVASTASTFTITATRKPGTRQANDKCGDFVLDQANRRTIVNNGAGMTAADCWNR